MKNACFILIVFTLTSCREKSVQFNENHLESELEPILHNISCDTIIVNKHIFKICQSSDINMFLLNESKDTIYKHPEWTNKNEFIDFNHDGYKDILFHYVTNVPGIYDLALFNPLTNTYKLVEDFGDYAAPVKMKDSKFYYSYERNGCSDYNWYSELFYIQNYKCYTVGSIKGVGCEGEEKSGIFIYKISKKGKELIKYIPREPGYYEGKWAFLQKYWTENYGRFQ